ncbi:MAG: metallophosphoesterase [Thermoplasmata archaeon]|nr:metallophosphoesterase [Thermoplasmata archaeon]
MDILPVPGLPLLFLKKERTLVAADLHIGIEKEFREAGVTIPPQWPRMAETLIAALKENGGERILLLGDVKHRVPSISFTEEKAVPIFFRRIMEEAEAHVIPGNHDGHLRALLPRAVTLHPSTGMVLGNTGFFHGHSWPSDEIMSCETVVMGHLHPSLALTDEIGTTSILPCWARCSLMDEGKVAERYDVVPKELVVMPALSDLRRGTPINKRKWIGPIGRSGSIDIDATRVYLLDGSFLGELGGIR